MKLFKTNILVLVISLILFGCATSKSFVNFEILEPATITYPDYVTRVGLLNRSPLCYENLSEVNREKLGDSGILIVDTIVCNNLIRGFQAGKKSDNISYLQKLKYLESRRRDTLNKSDTLNKYVRDYLFNKNDLDALIVLDYYYLNLDKSFSFFSYEVLDNIVEFRLSMEVLWTLYIKDSENPLDRYKTKDTLYFINREGYPISSQYTATSVLREGCYEFGYQYGFRHIPEWNEVARVIFRGGEKGLRNAASYTDNGDWDNAAAIWKVLLNSPDSVLAAKANHNMAVFYEIDDQIITADKYATTALALWKNTFIESYKQDLDTRLSNRDNIFRQIRVEE